MKLLVFAHTPPPHHGQSYMVQLMLAGFGGDRRQARKGANSDQGGEAAASGKFGIECYHVNARLSQKLEEIGDLRVGKLFLLLGYCLQALWCRFRYGATTLYYIPAPGKHSALFRDWVAMLICRPFFKRVILHWHAAGLAKWLETAVQIRIRSLTYWFLKQVDLSIVLSRYNQADAEKLFARRIQVVSNGIPDPCAEFETEVLPRRHARLLARRKLASGQPLTESEKEQSGTDPQIIKVLYLAHCTREKGLFDSVAGIALANQRLAAEGSPLSLRLFVTGTFVREQDKTTFDRLVATSGGSEVIQYLGFVSGTAKNQLLREADLFCFPTFYENENQPVNLLEAMAFGLPILTTRWRSIPELFPSNYPGLVKIASPPDIASGVIKLALSEGGDGFRDLFLRNFTLQRHLAGLAEAFTSAEQGSP
jgi:glycosyltransferase involved in cell wall biosynthesis